MDALYSVMQGLESRLGGGEGVEGIYGSITATGMHKVLECMRHNCGLSKSSTLVDIGAGLGRPLLHALLLHGVAHGYGVELDKVKVAKAEAFCRGVLEELLHRGIISSDSTTAVSPSNCNTYSSKLVNSKSNKVHNNGDVAGAGVDQQHQQQQQQEKEQTAQESVGSQPGQQQRNRNDSSRLQSMSIDTELHAGSQVSCTSAAASTCASVANDAAGSNNSDAARKGATRKQKGLLCPPQSTPIITCASIEQVASLEPATHAYSFWEGVPESGKRAFGRLFRTGRTLKAVAVVQRAIRGEAPEAYMAELGFGPLLLIKAFPVKMSGSGRSFQAYVFSKPAAPSANLLMRCTGKQQQDAAVPLSPLAEGASSAQLEPGLASACKPRKQQQQRDLSVADAAAHAAKVEAETETDGSPQQQQWQASLVHLRTETSTVQQAASPGKRQQQQKQGGATAADADDVDGGVISPAKKQRGGTEAAAPPPPAAAAAAGYGLRPRQLSYCSSGLSSGAAGSSSRSRTTASSRSAAAAAGTTTAAGGNVGSRSSSRRSKATAAAAGDDKSATSGSTVDSSARSRCVSTAVSGGGSRARSRGKATATAAAAAAAGGGEEAVVQGRAAMAVSSRVKGQQEQQREATVRVGTLRQQTLAVVKQQQQQVSAAAASDISAARQAVSALGVASTITS